jgi:hypothetical protein
MSEKQSYIGVWRTCLNYKQVIQLYVFLSEWYHGALNFWTAPGSRYAGLLFCEDEVAWAISPSLLPRKTIHSTHIVPSSSKFSQKLNLRDRTFPFPIPLDHNHAPFLRVPLGLELFIRDYSLHEPHFLIRYLLAHLATPRLTAFRASFQPLVLSWV